MTYARAITVPLPFAETVERVREALQDQGFGVLTEIDVTTTLKTKLDEQIEDYLILGACNPSLAHRALDVDRSIGLLLPCNVVVRDSGDGTLVEIADPEMMVSVTGDGRLATVAGEARERLDLVLSALGA